jgi:TonB-dependent receptor
LFNGARFSSLQFRPGTNLVTGGTVNAPPGSLFSFQGGTFNETDTYQYAAGFRYSPGALTVSGEIARTESTFLGSTESVDRRWTKGPTINFNTNEPEFTITNINFSDPAEQFFDGLYEQNQKSAGEDLQVRGDVEYEFDRPLIRSIQAGIRYTDRTAERRFSDRFARPANRVNATALPVTFEVFEGVDEVGGTTEWAAPTYESIRDNVAALRTLVGFSADPIPAALLYTADEENLAGYGQINLGSGDLEGTIGLRVSHVETRVAGATPSGVPAIDEGSSETSVLPNASVRARVNDRLQLRGAVSKTRTLPGFAALNPATTLNRPASGALVGTPSDPYTASGGNPFLEPFTSWNIDAAAEFYLARSSFASVTLFHRDIEGFIQQNTFRVEDPQLGVIEITGPVNTGKGRISGVELQGQAFADFDWAPEWARSFGIQANLTYIDAETEQPSGPGGAPLTFQPITGDPARQQDPGVSEWTYNLVGIYERDALSARLTYSGQSSFRATRQYRTGGNVGQFNDTYTETAHPADRLDLSVNYDINDQFTVFTDWTNITETPFEQDFTSARNGAAQAEYLRYKRFDESTFSVGFRFRFGA